jgi:hypothetical protein
MKPETKSLPRIDESRYEGEWLALHPESLVILAHGKSLKSVREAAAKRGVRDPLMHSVPDSHGYFVGAG